MNRCSLGRWERKEGATRCQGPIFTAQVYNQSTGLVVETHTNCVRQCTQDDMGPRAVAVRTVRRGPYEKMCIDPDGNQYLLMIKDDLPTIEIWMSNSSKPRSVNLTGRIRNVRDMVWCREHLYLTDCAYVSFQGFLNNFRRAPSYCFGTGGV